MEFHVSRAARERFRLREAPFSLDGNVVLADVAAARRLAHAINQARPPGAGDPVEAGELYAMGVIDEILHFVVARYRAAREEDVLGDALEWLRGRLGASRVESTLGAFVELFPSAAAYRDQASPAEYVSGVNRGRHNDALVLEELILLWLANANPAFAPFRELFDDTSLATTTAYPELIAGLQGYFASTSPGPPLANDARIERPEELQAASLLALLRSPAVAVPESLAGQLRFMRERWGLAVAGDAERLDVTLGVLDAEAAARWQRFHPTEGEQLRGAIAPTLGFAGLDEEAERFSRDTDWMPRLVLLAKSTYVWLDQLSRAHGRGVTRLDQIPDEELDRIADSGFTGLWLIGLWERSPASALIKRMRGSTDAVASAYSLFDYRIAQDLGGQAGYEDLRGRAEARGIRLASDMVPNHMGIDSAWVMEHPERFISTATSPFPAYSFTGPDLSGDPAVRLHLEDHYYDGTDAAVVFKRVDVRSGDERYVYHGNDGTSMPWNDTAQLDYLRADVREAVIETILEVARRFPVIRFDAAMTLARRHFQRLWYPEPGSGGAIPSRAEAGMSREAFARAMPTEFWREVVDRVAAEAPGTLLLAEAFWLMEGYFVRTLGMHRVYNSAFMNMMRDEQNAEYRRVIRETIDFDPEILQRYVNFMNNPDERTAVDQFGKADKYFGVCTLLATLPGLPMFGHGQVEGFTEKYGMEFRRARYDERPDEGFVAEHRRRIFPLLHRRELFAGARSFVLYDFVDERGRVVEDVFAYSNREASEPSLVVFHNRASSVRGWVRSGEKSGAGVGRLAEALGVAGAGWCAVRDEVSELEFLRSADELRSDGLYLELGEYASHVFLGVPRLLDPNRPATAPLAARVGREGLPSVHAALRELDEERLRDALRSVLRPEVLGFLRGEATALELLEERTEALSRVLKEVQLVTAPRLGARLLERLAPLTDPRARLALDDDARVALRQLLDEDRAGVAAVLAAVLAAELVVVTPPGEGGPGSGEEGGSPLRREAVRGALEDAVERDSGPRARAAFDVLVPMLLDVPTREAATGAGPTGARETLRATQPAPSDGPHDESPAWERIGTILVGGPPFARGTATDRPITRRAQHLASTPESSPSEEDPGT